MPASDVTVAAAFAELPPDNILDLITDPMFLAFCEYSMENDLEFYIYYMDEEVAAKAWDTNGDKKLSPEEAAAVEYINLDAWHHKVDYDGDGGVSLEGIRYFTGLTYLECIYSGDLISLDVSGMASLKWLQCRQNDDLESLDLTGCTALIALNCQQGVLTKLDVSDCTLLTDLNCSDNLLDELDVSGNTALTELSCYANKLDKLDLSQNIALTNIYCHGNQLSSLDVSKHTALKFLTCGKGEANPLTVTVMAGKSLISNISVWTYDGDGNNGVKIDSFGEVAARNGVTVVESKDFYISPNSDQNVSAEEGNLNFGVYITRGMSWSVSLSNTQDFRVAGNIGGGTGSSGIDITYDANNTGSSRSTVVTFETKNTDVPAANRKWEVTVTQAAAAP